MNENSKIEKYSPTRMSISDAVAEYTKAKDNLDFANLNRYLTAELLDEDGYPTNEALEIVKLWHWTDRKGWFEFIKSIWWTPSFGWHEEDGKDTLDNPVHRFHVSTGGWSGNESIIRAMEENTIWHMTWVQSKRGGHYIFEYEDWND